MDYTGGRGPLFDAEKARLQFESANSLVVDIEDQNRRSDLIDQVTDADMQAIATEWLAVEQQNTLAHLQAEVNNTPYQQLGQRLLELDGIIVNNSKELKQRIEEAKAAIDKEADFVISIAPLSEESTRQMAETKKAALDQQLNEVVPMEILDERAALSSLMEIISTPWPLPKATTLESINASTTETIREIIDEMPTELTISGRDISTTNRPETHAIYERELTPKLIEFLSQNPNRIISVRELCEAIYSPQILATMKREDARALITTGLGPKVKGAIVRRALIEKGFVLQYGRRIERIRENGSRTQVKSKRIYRTIPAEAFSELHLSREEDDNVLWEATTEQVEIIERNKANADIEIAAESGTSERRLELKRGTAKQLVIEALLSNTAREMTPQELARIIYPESEAPIQKLSNRISAIISGGRDYINQQLQSRGFALQESVSKGSTVSQSGRRVGHRVKTYCVVPINPETHTNGPEAKPTVDVVPEKPMSAEKTKIERTSSQNGGKKASIDGEPQWQSDFRSEAEQAILGLSELGYIQGGNILPMLSSKSNGATKTVLQHMRTAGILSNTKFKAQDVRAADLVSFRLLAGNRSLYRDPAKKVICERIIQAEISRYLAEKQKRQETEAVA